MEFDGDAYFNHFVEATAQGFITQNTAPFSASESAQRPRFGAWTWLCIAFPAHARWRARARLTLLLYIEPINPRIHLLHGFQLKTVADLIEGFHSIYRPDVASTPLLQLLFKQRITYRCLKRSKDYPLSDKKILQNR